MPTDLGSFSRRRLSPPTRQRLALALARAWDALEQTYIAQAVGFVRLLRPVLPTDEALKRFFLEVTVPDGMHAAVHARALLALEHELGQWDTIPPVIDTARLRHPMEVLSQLRRRVHEVEELQLRARLAASIAEEAIVVVHVEHALDVADLLTPVEGFEEAIVQYLRSFRVPTIQAQGIFQRALARLAERHPIFTGPRTVVAAAPAAPRLGEGVPISVVR